LQLQFEHFLDIVRGEADLESERATLLAPHAIAEAIEAQATNEQ